ncbi:MAG: hypothetical protein SOU14_07560 [Succiniclasticum sp.]|nr:hypothetical protein [Succiniclasticum sp.]MDY6303781.1 hypothetical protein [Succiniclasticum sp.]
MNFGWMGLSFGQIVNLLLYLLSGILFGLFSSRQSIFCVRRIRAVYGESGFGFRFLTRIPFSVLFLVCAFALFPGWFATRTVAGATAYLAVLLYFFSKGWSNTRP